MVNILYHLSMNIPRSWWEKALKTNSIQNTHANILHDLQKELLNIPVLIGKIDSGLLVALAFADKKGMKPTYSSADTPFSWRNIWIKQRRFLYHDQN